MNLREGARAAPKPLMRRQLRRANALGRVLTVAGMTSRAIPGEPYISDNAARNGTTGASRIAAYAFVGRISLANGRYDLRGSPANNGRPLACAGTTGTCRENC
jgi:hypothetical protein